MIHNPEELRAKLKAHSDTQNKTEGEGGAMDSTPMTPTDMREKLAQHKAEEAKRKAEGEAISAPLKRQMAQGINKLAQTSAEREAFFEDLDRKMYKQDKAKLSNRPKNGIESAIAAMPISTDAEVQKKWENIKDEHDFQAWRQERDERAFVQRMNALGKDVAADSEALYAYIGGGSPTWAGDARGNMALEDVYQMANMVAPKTRMWGFMTSEDEKYPTRYDATMMTKALEGGLEPAPINLAAYDYEYRKMGAEAFYEKRFGEDAWAAAEILTQRYMGDNDVIDINGETYKRDELKSYLYSQIADEQHKLLLDRDHRYMYYLFEKETGQSYEDYMRDRADELKRVIKELRDEAGDEAASSTAESTSMGSGGGAARIYVDRKSTSREAAEKPYDDLLERIEAWEENDFASNFAEAFDWSSALSFGTIDLINSANLNRVLKQAERGEKLHGNDARLLELAMITQELEGVRDIIYDAPSTAAKWGQGLGTTAAVMPQFVLGMGLTGGIMSGVKYGAKYALKRFMVNKTIANAGRLALQGGKDLLKWSGVNYVRGMAGAPMMPMFYKGVLDGYNSQYSFNDNGDIKYTPKDKATIWVGSYIDAVNEITSEHFGAGFGDVVGLGLKGAGRVLGINKVANKTVAGAVTRKVLQAPMKESTKKFLKNLGFSGSFTGEWTGEMFGDLMSQWQRYMVGAEYDFEHFKDFDTWLTTIGVSAIMGGAMTTLGGGMTIYQESKAVKDIAKNRERIINSKIQDAALRDKLRMLSEADDPIMAASELATFFKTHNIENASDKAYALDYVMLNSQLKVLMGDVQEQEHMAKFEVKRAEIEGKAYKGADGKTTNSMYTATDAEGNTYYVLSGDMANKEAMLELQDANTGEITTKVTSALTIGKPVSVDAVLVEEYGSMFDLEMERERVESATNALSSVENPTMEHIETTAAQLDITLPKEGDVVTMVDGRTAEITEDLGDGTYIAQRKESLTGESETITLPFDAIRSNDSLTAMAQEAILKSSVEATTEVADTPQPTAEVQAPNESMAETPSTVEISGGYKVGEVVVTPNGEQARVVEVNDDGTATIDYNMSGSASMADAAIEVVPVDTLRRPNDASANTPIPPQTEIPTPAVPQPMAEQAPTTEEVDAAQNVEQVPTNEDGTVNFDAIEDPAQCAQIMSAMLGGPENALAIVEESIEAVKAEREKVAKSKAPSLNEGVAKQQKLNELKARLIRYEQIAFELEQMMKPAESKAESKTEEVKHEAGLVENEHTADLPEAMRNSINEMAKRIGVRVVFVDERIKGDAEQKGNLIRVSTRNRTKAVEVLVGHEMLHYMKTQMPEAYKAFKKAVADFIGEKEFVEAVAARKAMYAAQNVTLDDEAAAEEIVADFAGYLVQGRDVFEKFIEPKKSDNIFLRGLKKGLEYIRNIFGANGMTKNVSAVDNMVNQLNTLINATVEGKDIEKVEESKAETEETEKTEDGTITNDKGYIVAEQDSNTGGASYSLRTYEEGGRDVLVKFLKGRVKSKALTQAEADDMIAQMDAIYRVCVDFKDKYVPFGEWSDAAVVEDKDGKPVFSVIKKNGDYAMNLDFSLVCKKRRTLDAVLNEMIKRGTLKDIPNDATSIATINDVIRKYGFETACRLCFVDARRFRALAVADDFAELYNSVVEKLIPEGAKVKVNYFDFSGVGKKRSKKALDTMDDSELNIDALKALAKGDAVENRIARHLLNHPEDRRYVQREDFVSTAGFNPVKAVNPEILKLYNAKKGSGGPKASFGDVQYLNDVVKARQWTPAKAYAVGGVRLQSFSDYVPRMVFDYMQMIAELAGKKLPVHAYTKEVLFAKTFGLTGMKINLSLVPKVVDGGIAAGLDAEGNYVWQEGETFPYEEAVAIQNAEGYKKNCGTIAVGVSDEHIMKMLDDPNIRMVIPYHRSGLNKAVAVQNKIDAFKDYTDVQNTRKDGVALTKEENKYAPNFNELLRKSKGPRKAANAYLEWCEMNGYTPKFDAFASHPNYYKLLEDFTTMVDEVYMPQEAVTFTFPTEESAFGSLESLIEQGLEEDAVLEGQRDEKVSQIVDELQGVKYSISTNAEEFDATRDLAVQNIGIVMPNITNKKTPIVRYVDEERTPIKSGRKEIKEWAKKNVVNESAYIIDSNGNKHNCPITPTALDKYVDDSTSDKNVSREVHLLAMPLLSKILANSIEVEIHPDYLKKDGKRDPENGYNANVLIHRFYGAVEIDGQVYRAKSTVKEFKDKNTSLKPYSYEITKIELLAPATDNATDGTTSHLRTPSNSIDASKLLQNVEKSYDKGVKILDESVNYSLITPEMDATYLDAVERGDMETAQRMVLEAAKRAGYTEEVYHGTPHFGFTTFRSHRLSGAIFTSTRRNVSANYAGDGNYASVRGINKGYKEPHSSEDIIENAKSVLEQDYHIATPAEREAVIEKVEAEAKRVMQKMESLKEKAGEFSNDIADDIAWVENVIYSGATSRENGNEGDELSQMLKDDYDRFAESREALREYDKSVLTDEQKAYLSFLTGYEVGDIAIDVAHSYANAVSSQDLATAGEAIVTMDWLADVTKRANEIGSYHLMGDLGANPLIIDAQGNAWYALDFNGMRETDVIAEWAKDNGYTSVVFKNIYDYGDASDVMVFFSSNQIKSADPVTYDDNGDVIPLSERFNPEKEDIRYSLPYNGDIARVFEDTQKIAKSYHIPQNIIVAGSEKDYKAAMLSYGVPEDKIILESAAVYLDWEDVIVVNALNIFNPEFYVSVLAHENMHAITRREKDKVEAITEKLPIMQILKFAEKEFGYSLDYIKNNLNGVSFAVVDEIISTFVEQIAAMPVSNWGYVLRRYLTGSLTIDEAMDACELGISELYKGEYEKLTDATKGLLRENLIKLRDEQYKAEKVGSAIFWGESGTSNGGGIAFSEENEEYLRAQSHAPNGDGATARAEAGRRGESADAQEVETRYSLSDMPFFDEQGNAIDMSAISEAKSLEMIDGRVRDMMAYDYDKSVIDITNQAKKDRRATRAYYAEERRKRRGGNEVPRTNAAKIDELFADTNINSLPLEVQALIFIAEGRAKIRWADKDGKRGLASELGLANSASDKAAMKSVWSGAEQSFDEVVHGWWESINGYERGIDTQDLRNALIEALMSFPSAKAAMRELQWQYDAIATAEREALEEIDRREAADLDRVKRGYEERSARFEMSEGDEREALREMAVEHYSSQPLSAADEALEELTDKLNKMERRAERLMLNQKSGYRELAESIEKSKEVIIRTLEHLRMFSGMEQIHIDEVAKLINMTRSARSKRQVEAVATKAKNLIQRIAIRKARENMRRLLDLKLSNVEVIQQILKESNTLPREERDALLKSLWKVSRNGWRATKAVHPDTKEIFKELNGLVKEYKKSVKDKEVATIKQAITDRLVSLEAELHPDVEVDDKGNVIDNAGLPVDFNDNNKNIALLLFKSYLEVEAKNVAYSEANKTLRETDKGSDDFGAAVANMYASRDAYLSAVKQFNATLEDVIVNGKDKLRDFNIEKEKHEIALRSMAIKAIGGKKASGQGKRANALQWARAGINITVNSPYWTFETVLERIDRLSPYKKGEFYNYFMRKYTDANAKLYTSYSAHMESIGSAMARCFPDMAKQFGIIGRNPYEIYKAVMRKAEATALGTLKYKENGVEREMQLTVANAMYIVAMWRQPRYREAMEANGITEGAINNLMQSINKEHAGYINFMDWVNTALLPNTRLEYDEVYRKLNGGSLAKEENYFPARVVTHEDVKLDENGKGQLPSSPSALKERISHKTMPKMGTDYFKVLEAHIQDMDKWAAFAELTADLNVILSSDEFRRRLNEFMPGVGGDGGGKGSLYKMLYDTALIATGNYHNLGENVFGPIQKAWATSNIAFRLWTAVKQISSVSVGVTEHVYFFKHMAATATVGGIAYEWKRAMELSPSLRYRWQSKAAGMEALMRETSRGDGYAQYRGGVVKTYDAFKDLADKAVKLGMTPNALVDAIACSILVNSVYDKAIHDMTKGKREATEEERKEAIRKAEIAFNSTQQSSEGAYLSAAQANPLYAPLTTYMNASYALHRKRMSGIHELWKLMTSKEYKRFLKDEYGVDAAKISAKDAFADIIRGIVGDLAFAAMGWGLMEVMSAVYEWLGGDGDDDDTEAEKQAFFETYLLPVFNGFLGGSQITSLFQGYDTSMTPAYDELLEDVGGIFDDKGDWRVEVAQFVTKYGLGIDLKSLYRIGAGLENMVSEETGENAGSILMFLNAPNRYIKAFVGDRREGETLQQYQTRVMRLYTLFDDVMYEELYDENGKYIGEGAPSMIMSQTQAKALNKEYEAAYLKDVVVRNGGWDEYRTMMSTEMLYKDICTFIGVTSDKEPNWYKIDEKYYPNGEFVSPVYGLSAEEHDDLLFMEYDISYAHQDRTLWVGDVEEYYNLLKEEYRLKNELIDKYNEYIK